MPQAAGQLFFGHGAAMRLRDSDVHLFTTAPQQASGGSGRIHAQCGNTFVDRLEHAVETVTALGYAEIVIIGRDCPELRADDIRAAFNRLADNRLVLGPDHRGGCYLIALHARDRSLLQGVRWKRNTDCAQIQSRCPADEIFLLPVKHDLDSWADLPLLAQSGDATAAIARGLLRNWIKPLRSFVSYVDLARHAIRVRGQMPPPAFAL